MIRAADLADLAALLEVERACFGADAWSDHVWQSELAGSHVIDVMANGESLTGFAIVMLAGDDAELLRIAVAPASRRSGIAQRLMAHALERALAQGVTSMFLEVESTNVAALGLYETSGFAPIHQRANYYGPGRDAVMMTRALAKVQA
ncbi:MAG: ribosomal protein S18-alanine N-acetyltransferase [Actinomycetales bacterium]|nr:ribosomal protein S18-alanine N-acetyltransferase [Actinomycetales bacterium]